MSRQKLAGKVAIITGSSDGIGTGIALEYVREGAFITLTGRSEEKLKKVAEECEKISPNKKKPLFIAGDITKDDVRHELISKTIEKYGKIDILVNNAGYVEVAPAIEHVDLGILDSMLNIHVRVPYHLTKLAIPELIKNKGILINISSIAGMRPCPPCTSVEYGMAKAAMDQFTQWMARELGPHGVRANAISPGVIRSHIDRSFAKDLPTEEVDKMWEMNGVYHALQRIGQPSEIGKVAVFLASEDSSFVTGNVMPVDGGFLVMPTGSVQPTTDGMKKKD